METPGILLFLYNFQSGRSFGWIICAPCIFLRTSTTFKKMALTTLTLLVTSLLVASPILFLTQFALPARNCTRNHCIPPPKCELLFTSVI